MAERKEILTPVFRVSYPHVFKPQKDDDGRDVYSVAMIFEPDADLSEMKALAKETKAKKFGANPSGKFKKAFRKGTKDEFDLKNNPEYEGNIIVSARSKDRPVQVVRIDKSKPKNDKSRFVPITSPTEFYPGCYAMAKLSCYAYDHPKGGRGVAFGLQNLLFVKNGEPFTSISNPEDDFSEVDADDDMFEDVDNEDMFDDDEDFDL